MKQGLPPAYTQNQWVRAGGKVARVLLWMKAMAISGVIWTFALCFVFMGVVLPWKTLTILNWGLIGTGLAIGYGAYRFDRMVWRAMRPRKKLESESDYS